MNAIIDGVEYQPVTKPQIPDGFIPWDGGVCPVKDGEKFEYCQRGNPMEIIKASCVASYYEGWRHMDKFYDIIGYRVVKPATVMIGDVECPVSNGSNDSIDYSIGLLGDETTWIRYSSKQDRDQVEQAIIKLLDNK